MLVLRLTFLVRSSSCMRSLFPIMTCSSNRPQRRHCQYPLFEGDSSCSTCKISCWILFYSNPASSLTSRLRITIIDDWCRRYRSRENPVVVCHSRWGSEGGRAAKVWPRGLIHVQRSMLTTPKWSNHLAEEEEPGLSTGNNQDTQNTMAMGKSEDSCEVWGIFAHTHHVSLLFPLC